MFVIVRSFYSSLIFASKALSYTSELNIGKEISLVLFKGVTGNIFHIKIVNFTAFQFKSFCNKNAVYSATE